MQFDASAGQRAATCCDDDTAPRTEATPGSQLVHEDEQLECDQREQRERIEADVLERERVFQATFDRAAIGIAHVSPDGHLLRINRRLCDLLGYDRAELTTRTWQEITHPDDLAADLAYVRRLLAGEIDEYEMDKRYVRQDGAPVWAHLTATLVRTSQGEPDYFITMVQDITTQKHLEQERAQLLERERAARAEAEVARAGAEATNARLQALQALTDTALSHLALDDLLRELLDRVTAVMGVDHVAIFLLDADGRTLTLRAGRVSGQEHVGWVQVPVGPGFTGRIAASRTPLIVDDLDAYDVEVVHPTLRETARSAAGVPLLVAEQAEDGVAAGHLAGRLVGVLFVGSTVPRRFTQADVPLLQRAADRVALAIDRARLYAAEQEARQCAEAALARAQASEAQATERAEQLRTILETMADGVAVYDTKGRPVQLVNQAYRELYALERAPAGYETLTTFERARLVHVRDVATGASLSFEDTPAGRALRGEVVTGPSGDIRARAFDGRELEVNSSAAPLRDGEGRVVGTVLVLRDVTWRRRLEREREAARVQAVHQAEQLDRIFEAVADGLIVYDAAGQYVRANPAARRIVGLDAAPPGFEQMPLLERLAHYAARDEQDRPMDLEEWPFVRILRGEVKTEAEVRDVRMRALDGREIELTFSAAPLCDREGHLVGAVSVFHDMTERNRLAREREEVRARAEAALARAVASEAEAAERAERLSTILETMADGVAVYDAEGRPIQVTNRAYRELFALERAPAGYETLTTRDRVRLLDLRDAATGAPLPFEDTPPGRALRGEVVTGPSADVRMRAFDGRELEVNDSATPLRDGDGRVVGAVLVLRDVTWRRRLECEREAAREQAERQAEQLDRIFEAVADGLIVYDAAGQYVRANPAARRILGADAAPPGFDWLPLLERLARYAARDEQDCPIPPEEQPFVRVLRGEVETGSRVEARDIRMRALDGREIELTYSTAPLRDREGHLVGAVNVMYDQTERNRLAREREVARADELAAREANRRLEQFLAVAAHDLRTPLTATIGYLDLAERQSERLAAAVQASAHSPELVRQVALVRTRLDDASQGAERLAQLLTLLFDTAALRAGRLELHRAPCDLAALVREQVAALRVAAPDRRIRLHVPSGDAPVPVEVDTARIGQVVTNYVTNALKYAPPDRPVDVSVLARGSRAHVAVCDQGPGIPKAEQARVWEVFHRVPGVTAQSGTRGGATGGASGSLGLGLHISKAVITAHGGRIGVKSVVGKGSTFWFTLPLSGPRSDPGGTTP